MAIPRLSKLDLRITKKRITQIKAERVVRKLDLGRKLLLVVGMAVSPVPVVLGQVKVAQRVTLVAVDKGPMPFHTEEQAMITVEEMPSLGEIAEVQVPNGADATLPPGQAKAKPFAFDVVSIRPATVNDGRVRRIGIQFTDDGFVADGQSLVGMLMSQYRTELQQDFSRIVGGPDWMSTLRWDIRGKVADSDIAEWTKLSHDSSAAAMEHRRATVEAMLAERFKLKMHIEIKDGTVYALVVAKGGPKLKPSKSAAPPPVLRIVKGQGHFSSEWTTVASLVPICTRELGHPVIDKTGITGRYEITLDWAPTQGGEDAPGGDASEPQGSSAPSIFTAVQEQLGLKLDTQKGPVETLVIDSAEKPSVDGAEVQASASLRPVVLAQDSGTASLTAFAVVPEPI